ncbi:MAG: diguanylate cyclase [Deltaproteobacteria bacterium]|nr:diguanylate cyclase [Deltaproteobacteria bacterium]
MKKIVNSLLYMRQRINKNLILLFSVMIVAFVGYLDWITKHYLIFAIFYLIPISLTVMFSGRVAGLFVSFIAVSIWLVMDLNFDSDYSHILYPVINNFMRFGYFSIHVFMLSSLIELLLKAEELSVTDTLTGIKNSRAFYSHLGFEVNRAKRNKSILSIVYFDLDNFKEVNDVQGHSAGDGLLKAVADTVKGCLRETDIFARIGGDEFSVILPDTGEDETCLISERFIKEVIAVMKRNGWPVTLSVGAITFK